MEDWRKGLVKTNVRTARKLFETGKPIYLLPNKVRLINAWVFPYAIDKNRANGDSFDNIVNAFSYYNCNNELGNSVSYYKEA